MRPPGYKGIRMPRRVSGVTSVILPVVAGLEGLDASSFARRPLTGLSGKYVQQRMPSLLLPCKHTTVIFARL